MSITEISAKSDTWNKLLTDLPEAHPCRITADVVGHESKRGATIAVTDLLEHEKCKFANEEFVKFCLMTKRAALS